VTSAAVMEDAEPAIDYELVAALQNDTTMLDPAAVAQLLGVSSQYVYEWHSRTIKWLEDHPGQALPLHHDMIPLADHPTSDVRLFAPQHRGGRPRWFKKTVVRWAQRVERMRPDGTPQPRPLPGQRRNLTVVDPAPADINYAQVAAFQDSDEKWGYDEMAAALGFQRQTAKKRLVFSRKWRDEHPDEPLPLRADLPPLPDHPESTHQYPAWYAGTIYLFGMRVERIDAYGQPQKLPRRGGRIGRTVNHPESQHRYRFGSNREPEA
jgi:hypothetical protein